MSLIGLMNVQRQYSSSRCSNPGTPDRAGTGRLKQGTNGATTAARRGAKRMSLFLLRIPGAMRTSRAGERRAARMAARMPPRENPTI